jgi:hypothetical protein
MNREEFDAASASPIDGPLDRSVYIYVMGLVFCGGIAVGVLLSLGAML